jgi:CheY-like chemotaxis protein
MTAQSLNLKGLVFLVADSNPYFSRIVVGLLRSFGANSVAEVRNSFDAIRTLNAQKVDILLCDDKLPPHGGLQVTHAIRRKADNENRTVPILIMAGDTRESLIKIARDAGANMVVAKPLSPSSLYDRLSWIAFNPRQFVETTTCTDDRRFKIEGYPGGVGRRKGDKAEAVAAEAGPTMGQSDIDNLFKSARRTELMAGEPKNDGKTFMIDSHFQKWRVERAASRASRPWKAPRWPSIK